MAEFLPASLLSRGAAYLGVTEGVAGQSVAITAIVAAVAGITIPVVLSCMDRRHLMIILSALAVVSDVLVAIAPTYPILLAARVLLGIAIGGFLGLSLLRPSPIAGSCPTRAWSWASLRQAKQPGSCWSCPR
jgi:predicted MFS family arabinose efflux permease